MPVKRRQPAHYDTVGAALLDTLQTGLGAAFTPELLREAWTAMYTLVATTHYGEVRLPWHRRPYELWAHAAAKGV